MIHKDYLSILHQFTEPYKQDTNVIGIFLVGSYAYGTPHKNSDLDVYIITQKGDTRTKGTTIINELEVEYFINPLSQVKKYLDQGRDNISTAHMLAHGMILYERSPDIQKLIFQSQYIRNTPGVKLSNTEKELIKYTIDDLSKNLEDYLVVEDNINFHITQSYLINKLISTLFDLHQQHLAKKYSPYKEIIKIDSHFGDLLKDIYLQNTLANKYKSTKTLAEYIERKLGGHKSPERFITGPCV